MDRLVVTPHGLINSHQLPSVNKRDHPQGKASAVVLPALPRCSNTLPSRATPSYPGTRSMTLPDPAQSTPAPPY